MVFYGIDLAHIHHTAFGAFADKAAAGLLERLEAGGIRGGLVIDLGCGSGLWAAHLLRAGYSVLGIDISDAMVRIARKTAPEATFIVGSAHALELPSCAAVTAIGEGISYLRAPDGDLDLNVLFRRVQKALPEGGLFVFDVIERSPEDPMCYDAARSGPDWQMQVSVSEEPSKRLLTRVIRLNRLQDGVARHTTEVHYVRTFDRPELEQLLASAGYSAEVTRRYGGQDLPPRRLGFIARKTARPRAVSARRGGSGGPIPNARDGQ